jgi:GPH family glycoside/pentoside/hexuronide:cation symporter
VTALDPSQPLPTSRKLGYGVGIYGIFLVWMMTAITLMNFYTEVLGLSAAQAGTIFLVASLWDAVTDPLMGWINDRVSTRWGRYRPWLLFATPAFVLSFIAMFSNAGIAEPASVYAVALILHLVFRTFYTAVYMPYTAMIATLSSNGPERASLGGVKSVFTALAGLTVSLFALDAVEWLGQGNDALGFQTLSVVFAVVATAALWLCFASTREPPLVKNEGGSAPPMGATVKALSSNRAFWLIFFGVIAFTGCYTMINKAIVYDSQWNLGDRTLAKYSLTAISLAGVLSPLLWVPVSRAASKRTTWIAGCLVAAAALGAIYALPQISLWARTAIFFVGGCGISAVLMTFFAALADAADYGEWRTGVRVEALLFGLVSFANKISLGVGAWALGVGLDSAGYRSGKEVSAQAPEALAAITTWMTMVPAAGFLLSAVIIAFFPVSNKVHATIESDLRERRRARTAEPAAV